MAQEKIELVTDSHLAGQKCIFCGRPLQPGEQAVICPRCRSPHHVSCWQEKGGCARPGCPQVAEAVRLPPRPAPETAAVPSSFWQRLSRVQKGLLSASILLVLLLIGFLLSRTFGSPPASSPPRLTLAVPITLWEGKRYETLAAEFKKKHPGVQVDVVAIPNAIYYQKLTIMVGTQEPVDVFALPPSFIQAYVDAKALMPLDERIQELARQGRTDLAELAFHFGDHVYGVRRAPNWPMVFVLSSRSRHPDLAWALLMTIWQATVKDPPPPPGFTIEPATPFMFPFTGQR
ncbi:MAG TPA: extracellular solute-binding protein [Firmicutes bacterium]|nr:extracellular solute-binding protein [Bacillota bacterium]